MQNFRSKFEMAISNYEEHKRKFVEPKIESSLTSTDVNLHHSYIFDDNALTTLNSYNDNYTLKKANLIIDNNKKNKINGNFCKTLPLIYFSNTASRELRHINLLQPLVNTHT